MELSNSVRSLLEAFTGGVDAFTPSAVVFVLLFGIVFDGFCSLISALLSLGGRK